MTPRALVVRSGANPHPFASGPLRVEIVERVSHSVEPFVSGGEALGPTAQLAIFTSQIAVRRLFEEKALLDRFREAISGGRVAAVGQATAEALRAGRIEPSIVAAGSGQSVLDRLPSRLEGWRILLPRGEDATEELPEALIRRGASVARVVLYRKIPRPPDPELEKEMLERPFAAFCTTSPAAARWLFGAVGEQALGRLRDTPAVVLGRFTGRFLAAHGITRIQVAREATFVEAASLLEALAVAGAEE